jgi:hypothetical protein
MKNINKYYLFQLDITILYCFKVFCLKEGRWELPNLGSNTFKVKKNLATHNFFKLNFFTQWKPFNVIMMRRNETDYININKKQISF